MTIAYHQVGHLNDEIYREIANAIKVPFVEVAEAATFYTMFPKQPRGKYLIQVCHNISCALMGADSLTGYLEQKLGIAKGETTHGQSLYADHGGMSRLVRDGADDADQ